jgi:hypothetical protein
MTTLFLSFTNSFISRCNLCVQNTKTTKSNDLYLLDLCNWRTRNWTRQTLGTCPLCAVRCEQENTEIYKHSLLLKKLVWASLWCSSRTLDQCQVRKLTFPAGFQWCYVSSNVGNFAPARRNFSTSVFRKWDVQIQHLPKLETHQRLYYKAKCMGTQWVVMTMGCEREGGGEGVVS